MARVNITVPDEIVAEAKAAGLNLSRVATAALADELDRRRKAAALDAYLDDLEARLGPIPPEEAREASAWAERVLGAAEAPARAASLRRDTA